MDHDEVLKRSAEYKMFLTLHMKFRSNKHIDTQLESIKSEMDREGYIFHNGMQRFVQKEKH